MNTAASWALRKSAIIHAKTCAEYLEVTHTDEPDRQADFAVGDHDTDYVDTTYLLYLQYTACEWWSPVLRLNVTIHQTFLRGYSM